MLVKISYTTELEDVPRETAKIVSSVSSEIKKLAKELDASTDIEDFEILLQKIKKSLKVLKKLDAKLEDCASILEGCRALLDDIRAKETNQNNESNKKQKKVTEPN